MLCKKVIAQGRIIVALMVASISSKVDVPKPKVFNKQGMPTRSTSHRV